LKAGVAKYRKGNGFENDKGVERFAVTPNPSLKRSANGMAHWPSGAGASPHFAPAVQRVLPLAPA